MRHYFLRWLAGKPRDNNPTPEREELERATRANVEASLEADENLRSLLNVTLELQKSQPSQVKPQ